MENLERFLVGSWRLVALRLAGHEREPPRSFAMVLREDGTVTFLSSPTEEAHWEVVDDSHFNIRLVIPPDPDFEPLQEGATDLTNYEIVSRDEKRMVLRHFEAEADSVYERVPQSPFFYERLYTART